MSCVLQHHLIDMCTNKSTSDCYVVEIHFQYGPLIGYVKLRMHRECRERLPRQRLQRKLLVNDPGMHHGTRVTWWWVKLSRHSRRIRSPQFYVSVKRPIVLTLYWLGLMPLKYMQPLHMNATPSYAYESPGFSNQGPLNYLFNTLFKLTTA